MYWGAQPPPPAPPGGTPSQAPPGQIWLPRPPMQPAFPPQQLHPDQHLGMGHHHHQQLVPTHPGPGAGFQQGAMWGPGQGQGYGHPMAQQPYSPQTLAPRPPPLAPPAMATHPMHHHQPPAWTPMAHSSSGLQPSSAPPPPAGPPGQAPAVPWAGSGSQAFSQVDYQRHQGYQQQSLLQAPYPPPYLPPSEPMQPPSAAPPPFPLAPPPIIAPPPPPPQPAAPPTPMPPPLPEEAATELVAPPLPPSVTDAADLFLPPGRSTRPARFAIVLRGIPGSGKSWAAKKLRDIEVAQGGAPPRISSLDTYFMQEVEKVEVDERGRKRKVISEEYEYEHEMEDSYAEDLVRSFRRVAEERRFSIVIIDAPNLRASCAAKFWEAGQKSGYDVFIAEPLETDPIVCSRRNLHNREQADIDSAAEQLEPAPSTFPHLDLKPLLLGNRDPFKTIRVVEMEESEAEEPGSSIGVSGPDTLPAGDGLLSLCCAFLPEDQTGASGLHPAALDPEATHGDKRRRFQEMPVSGQPIKQRSRWEDATDDNSDAQKGARPASALKRDKREKQMKRVKWADEVQQAPGFSIGGAAKQQLEQVFVVEGLGPGRAADETAEPQPATLRTFLFGVHTISNIDLPMKRAAYYHGSMSGRHLDLTTEFSSC